MYVASYRTYSKFSVRYLQVLQRFITAGHNLSNILYSDKAVLMADTEKRLQ